ncbi:MAG: GNAT family N-acetyltransferase [Rariglobus sp.]
MKTPAASRNPLRKFKASLDDMHARHRERHRPTSLGFVFADRVDYLDGTRWDAVAAHGSVFLQRDRLRLLETHGPENITPRYAMLFRGDRPVAILAAQIITVTGDRFQAGKPAANLRPSAMLRRVFAPAVKTARNRYKERMLVAGSLLAWGCHGVAFAPDEDTPALWAGIAEALYRIRRSERLTGQTDFTMVKDLTAANPGVESLRRFSYRPLETDPDMVLDLKPAWRTYDDYLAALDAKYRRKVKDQGKKLTSAGCTVELLHDLSPHTDRLHELYLAVQSNASVKLVTLRPGYLVALSKLAGPDFRCTVVKRGDKIIGFVTSLRDGGTAVGYYIGFDRAAAEEGLPVYLRLLHATIADAIAWRSSRLSLGRTALEPKAGLGARPDPMTVWMRHRVPAMNWLLRSMLGAVPHGEAPERNPFKTDAPAADKLDTPAATS